MKPAPLPAASTGPSVRASNFLVVGVADLQASQDPSARIVTYALGSCIGITLYDPATRAGGMLHFVLAQPSREADSEACPYLYATSGIPLLIQQVCGLGADRTRLVACAVGAAEVLNDGLGLGQRNHSVLRDLFWKENITIAAEDVGGHDVRNLMLELASGTITVRSRGEERILWRR